MVISMKSIFIRVVIPAMLFLLMVACSDDKRRIEKCVEAELNLHPEAHLVDLYKYFLQDVCGPGHLISNREEAEKYLDQELSTVKAFEPFDYQEITLSTIARTISGLMIRTTGSFNGNFSKLWF